MNIMHFTDLHGNINKYKKSLEIIKRDLSCIDVIVNSGDMYPKDINLFNQDRFIKGYLKEYFEEINELNIPYMCMPGNDDLKIFDILFEETCLQFDNIYSMFTDKAREPVQIEMKYEKNNGDIITNYYDFIGLGLVKDYPFSLKDRCRKDIDSFTYEIQFGPPLYSTMDKNGIKCWNTALFPECLEEKPTLKKELNILPRPNDMRKTIYIMHMPPSRLGLDMCADKRNVGSDAIYEFIKKNQPLLTLHGHIHESPDMTNKFYNRIGNTAIVQPGQVLDQFVYAHISINEMNSDVYINRFLE